MKKNLLASEISINSILGENTSFTGIFNINGPLRIDGNFSGKIISNDKVIIGKNGRAECIILANSITVGGTVKGDIYAFDKVNVLKTGEIIGNIYTSCVKMEDGVIFNGECKILEKNVITDLMNAKKKEKYNFI